MPPRGGDDGIHVCAAALALASSCGATGPYMGAKAHAACSHASHGR